MSRRILRRMFKRFALMATFAMVVGFLAVGISIDLGGDLYTRLTVGAIAGFAGAMFGIFVDDLSS